jgi:hypothetical protein
MALRLSLASRTVIDRTPRRRPLATLDESYQMLSLFVVALRASAKTGERGPILDRIVTNQFENMVPTPGQSGQAGQFCAYQSVKRVSRRDSSGTYRDSCPARKGYRDSSGTVFRL